MPANRTVAIVGRPNVGKSALFNRLAGRRISIVHDQPGVTRDRLTAECRLVEHPFTIVDTGGIGSNVDANFSEQVRVEADIAIQTADLLLLVVDAQEGITAIDLDLAALLRRVAKPLILVVNKIDHPNHEPLEAEFSRLGFEHMIPISAEHGRGTGELTQRIESLLPEPPDTDDPEARRPMLLAIVGRPNVGKSSLINAIISDRRTLVSDISGTTRDAVDIPYTRKDQRYILIDTAGIRPRGRQADSVEVFSVMRSERSIRRADLCVLVLDAIAGVTTQDKKIAGLIQDAQKPCIVAVNKWDLAESDESTKAATAALIEQVQGDIFFLDYAPVIPVSAKTGEHMKRLFRFIELVRDHAAARITTGPLNRLFQRAFERHQPPSRSGKRFKLLYAAQLEPPAGAAVPPPRFAMFVNDVNVLTPAYRKYLETQIRAESRFTGLPIIWQLKGREKRGKK